MVWFIPQRNLLAALCGLLLGIIATPLAHVENKSVHLPPFIDLLFRSLDNGFAEGNCPLIQAELSTEKSRGNIFAHHVLGEMYDQGLCFDKDPEYAFELFKSAVDLAYSQPYGSEACSPTAILSYKYANGDGVAADSMKAQRYAYDYAACISLPLRWEQRKNQLEATLGPYRPDIDMKKANAWIQSFADRGEEGLLELAAVIRDSKGFYEEGIPVSKNPSVAYDILWYLRYEGSPRAQYEMGIGQLNRKLPLSEQYRSYAIEGKDDTAFRHYQGERNLKQAAIKHNYVPAQLALADYYETHLKPKTHAMGKAYIWLRIAELNKTDVGERLRRVTEGLAPDGLDGDYRPVLIQEKQEELDIAVEEIWKKIQEASE